jgi:hypothetical protein
MLITHKRRFQLFVIFTGLIFFTASALIGVQARSQVLVANAPEVNDAGSKP